jgi:hypothetical protein
MKWTRRSNVPFPPFDSGIEGTLNRARPGPAREALGARKGADDCRGGRASRADSDEATAGVTSRPALEASHVGPPDSEGCFAGSARPELTRTSP